MTEQEQQARADGRRTDARARLSRKLASVVLNARLIDDLDDATLRACFQETLAGLARPVTSPWHADIPEQVRHVLAATAAGD